MDVSALVFLETPESRRLAGAWPTVGKKKPRRSSVSLHGEWAEIACVRVDAAMTHGEALRRVGICLPDGKLDPTAAKFLAQAAMAIVGVRSKKAATK